MLEYETVEYNDYGRDFYGVCFTSKGELITVCGDTFNIHSHKKGLSRTSISSTIRAIFLTSADIVYILKTNGDIVQAQLPGFENMERFLRVDYAIGITAINDSVAIIAAASSDTDTEITIYNMSTKMQRTHKIENTRLTSICYEEEGAILAVDHERGILYKYRASVEEGTTVEIEWKCEGIDGAFAVCMDEDGVIFVAGNKQKIYIVNDGETISQGLGHIHCTLSLTHFLFEMKLIGAHY